IQIGGQQAPNRGTLLETYLGSRLTVEHGGAVIGAGVGPYETISTEHVERFVVGIGPHAHLRIIIEVGILERIAIEGAGRVRRGGNSHALQERRGGYGKLREDPPIGCLVIEDDGIAIVVGLATSAKT